MAGIVMSEENEKIEFHAEVIRVQTMESGAIRVTLDMSEDSIMQMAQLAECKRWGAVLNVVATPSILTELDDETEKEPERNASDMDSRRRSVRRNQ